MEQIDQRAETAIEEYRLSILELERNADDYSAGHIPGYDDSRAVRAKKNLLANMQRLAPRRDDIEWVRRRIAASKRNTPNNKRNFLLTERWERLLAYLTHAPEDSR